MNLQNVKELIFGDKYEMIILAPVMPAEIFIIAKKAHESRAAQEKHIDMPGAAVALAIA